MKELRVQGISINHKDVDYGNIFEADIEFTFSLKPCVRTFGIGYGLLENRSMAFLVIL